MKKILQHISLIIVLFLTSTTVFAQDDPIEDTPIDSLQYRFVARQSGSLYLTDYENYNIIFNAEDNQYHAVTVIDGYEVSYPIIMTETQYRDYRLKKDMHEYYKSKLEATSKKDKGNDAQKDLLPKYYVNNNFFETIFGGNEIEVNMQGNIEIKMGVLNQRIDNPLLNEDTQNETRFDFNQNIGASIMANVGKRLKVSANYDTKSTFDFQNLVKIEFDPSLGYDDDGIVRKIEVGNVSMPMRSSLIQGAQNLFGVKTDLQFGKTTVSAVYAKQQSQSKTVQAEGGSLKQEFELKVSDYDANKHFFLSQYFRDKFDAALLNYPLISSQIQITNIEVWATNTNTTTENLRNIVALADLAEAKNEYINHTGITPILSPELVFGLPDNRVNTLNTVLGVPGIREISAATSYLEGFVAPAMTQGNDFSLLENAKRLQEGSDFILDRQLGFISLNRRLVDSDVLAVAFEFTINGSDTVYKVGELSSDGIIAPDNLVVKMLRPELVNTTSKVWDLMMKNIYNLQAYQLSEEGFRFELLYENDETGVPLNVLQTATTPGVNERTLLNLLHIDRLDQNEISLPDGDGYFDFVEGITVFSQKGFIMFPKAEPFGAYLDAELIAADDSFVFNELYEYTQQEVKTTYQSKDKYVIKGYYKSDSAQGISLGAFNVPQGSVHVTVGGRELVEGVDYVVDYQIGRVKIINPAIEASNAPISVSVEQNAIFSQQRRSFLGVDIAHKISENFIVGASYLRLSERPFTSKVAFGQEPIQNQVFGFNTSYSTESDFISKITNRLPFHKSDMPSNISVRGDIAYLRPGTPSSIEINGQAASYIDDFEGSQIPLNIHSPRLWYLSSTPQHQPELGLEVIDGTGSPLNYGKNRARMSWYNVDYELYQNPPENITNAELSRPEVRIIRRNELFPEEDIDGSQTGRLNTLDLAYYPSERGSYNYDHDAANINADGTFNNPEARWAGITRPLTITDFESSNIEYIQFWLMDPFKNHSITNEEGLPDGVDAENPINHVGKLFINLGNISEDVLSDNRKIFENGLPVDDSEASKNTNWGVVPTNQSLLYAFDAEDDHRLIQDVGYDGLSDSGELNRLTASDFETDIDGNPTASGIAALADYTAYKNFIDALPVGSPEKTDPASDNYHYYKGGDLDDINASVLQRYKNYNRTQGNSPTASMSPESYPTAATQYPDTEDINKDQTMSTVESYWQYEIDFADLDGVDSYVVDNRETTETMTDGSTQISRWYQFRIPIASGTSIPETGGITGFHSIRFMRMFMTGFKMPVVLRFGRMEMVRGEWRRYKYEFEDGETPLVDVDNFESGVVNIEENPGIYALPPGIERESLQGTTTIQEQNEQALTLTVEGLEPEDTRALFKNVQFDLRMFKRLQMFIHAESSLTGTEVEDEELVAVIRLGSDLSDNFYQIEKPLNVSQQPTGIPNAEDVWPEANELFVNLDDLKGLKLERYSDITDGVSGVSTTNIYPAIVPGEPAMYKLRVKGHPNLGRIKTIMLGVKNKSAGDQSAEIWFNELRVSEFDNEGGWAAVVSANANFTDVLDVAVTGRMTTSGYGNVDQSVTERNQEELKQYDAVSNLNVGKLLPDNWSLQIPLSTSIAEEVKLSKYDAQYQDILLEETDDTNSPFRNDSQDYTKRTSISLINVKKNRNPKSKRKQRFYDVENISTSYAFNEVYHRDYNVKKYLDQNVRASVGYAYSFKPKSFTPFKKVKAFKGKHFKLLKDFNFNLIPDNIGVNTNVIRSYNEQLSRTLITPGSGFTLPDLPTLKQRNFLFDWDYNIGYKPTKAIHLSFRAMNNHVYDSFNSTDEITLHQDFFNVGRPTQYHQSLDASYKVPIDKVPFMSFVTADYSYTADFDWQGASHSSIAVLGAPDTTVADLTGNIIQNANTHNLSVNVRMKKFYKEIGLTKLLRTKRQRKAAKNKRKSKKKDAKKTGESKEFTPKKAKKTGQKVGRFFYDLLTAVKTVKASYQQTNGTLLPGFKPEMGMLGRDNYDGGYAPTFGFVFGSQVEMRNRALENGWLVSRNLHGAGPDDDAAYYNQIFTRNQFEKMDFKIKVTPFKNFDIDLTANKIFTSNTSEQMDVVFDDFNTTPRFNSGLVSETGNFSMSYFMLGTTFDAADVLFQNFKENRSVIAARFASETGLDQTGFGTTSQQVILPAFLSAYSGTSASDIKLSAFRDIPIPNWSVRYRGLMKLKWFKKRFKNFSVSHSYRSSYSIVNFTNNLQYNSSNLTATDNAGNYFNEKLYSNIGLIEEFSPLVKVDIKLKNSFSFNARLNRDRMMTLNFNNNTMTQNTGTEYVVGLGYRIKDLKTNLRLKGKKIPFKGDLDLKLDVSLRDDKMMVRYFGEDSAIENDEITGGQNMFNLKFIADYSLSKSLQAGLYYNQDTAEYKISTTYPRRSISGGISVKYILGN